MNKRNCFFSLLIALILILAGCSPEMMAEPKGTLEVVISGGSKDIHPTISLDTAYYKLHAESDGGDALEATIASAEGPYTNSSVPAGSWAINVSAYNGDDIEIGKGSASATVEAGKKATAVVSIKELEGKGTLKVALIGASAGNSYTLNVYSALDISEPMAAEAFEAASDSLVAEVCLDNGFYVFDVACSNSMIKLPIKVAVRIVKGDTVTAEYSVSENGSVVSVHPLTKIWVH